MSQLSQEQIRMIDSLSLQLDRNQYCIDVLNEQQNELRELMSQILQQRPQTNNTPFRFNRRQPAQRRNNIFYDYNTPIQSNVLSRIDWESFVNSVLNTPVPIIPTQEQINNATRSILFSDISNNQFIDRCPISLEEFTEQQMVRQIIHCGHIFCETSFQEWFLNNVRCPVCRYDIREYSTDVNTTTTPTTSTTTTTTTTTNATTTPTTNATTTEEQPNTNTTRRSNLEFTFDIPSNNDIANRLLQIVLNTSTNTNTNPDNIETNTNHTNTRNNRNRNILFYEIFRP
jgi:hypothetical protein